MTAWKKERIAGDSEAVENEMKLLNEKTIAVVGVSGDPSKYGYKVFQSLVAQKLNVFGINPKGGDILGRKIYKNLTEVGIIPDVVITAVKPEVTERVVEECGQLGIKEIWMQPGSESANSIALAKGYGMTVTHSACIMVDSGIW